MRMILRKFGTLHFGKYGHKIKKKPKTRIRRTITTMIYFVAGLDFKKLFEIVPNVSSK